MLTVSGCFLGQTDREVLDKWMEWNPPISYDQPSYLYRGDYKITIIFMSEVSGGLGEANVKEFKHPFEYQSPNEVQVEQIKATRLAFKALYDQLQSLPASREKSLAITKLEEASMWANKGIVFN